MKVVIMVGGYVIRFWLIIKDVFKVLLLVGDRMIFDYILEKVVEIGFEIYIFINRFFESRFRFFVEKWGVKFIVEDIFYEEEKFGMIGVLKKIIEEIGFDDYLIIVGDNFFFFLF